MNFALKRNELLQGLEQVRSRVRQLEAELEQCQTQEQRMIGAIMLCEEGLAEEAAAQPPALEPEVGLPAAENDD